MAVNEVTVEQLKQAVEAGARVIDVREPDEYHSGHVPNARLVPLAEVPENIDAFESEQIVFVVCLSGGRSMRACEFLHGVGVSNVVNVIGGTAGWKAMGFQIETDPQA